MIFPQRSTDEANAAEPAAGQRSRNCGSSGADGHGEAAPESMLSMLLSLLASPWPRFRGERPARGTIKKTVMAALAHVDYYEDRTTGERVAAGAGGRSVGLSYREIKRRVEAEYPDSRIPMMTIRSYARDAKQQGLTMPSRRPYSMRIGKGGRSATPPLPD